MHSLSADEVSRLAKEDPQIRDHIELMERKSVLEYALQKIEDLKSLEASKVDASETIRKPRRLFWTVTDGCVSDVKIPSPCN